MPGNGHVRFGGRLPGKGQYPRIPDLAGQPTLHWNRPFGPVRWRRAEQYFLARWLGYLWRMREVQQCGTVAPGHDRYESGLRDRPIMIHCHGQTISWDRALRGIWVCAVSKGGPYGIDNTALAQLSHPG